MDFTALKAYMTSGTFKENPNTSIVCAQKRLTINKVKRTTNRNVCLTQIRKIPDNMSACNTPQAIRTGQTLDVNQPSINNITSKRYEEKQKLRLQRLREFKEKRDKLKQEEAARKKPIFKVRHASAENYDLSKIYNNTKGPSKEPYHFTAPENINAIGFSKNSPKKTQESPRKRVTRSVTRLALQDGVKSDLTVKRTLDNTSIQSKLNRNACEEGTSKYTHQLSNKRNTNTKQIIDKTAVTPKKADKTSKSRLHKNTNKEDMSSCPKNLIRSPKTSYNTISNAKREKSKDITKRSVRAVVKIRETEQMLTNLTLFEQLPDKNKPLKTKTNSTKIPVKTPTKVNQAKAQKLEKLTAKTISDVDSDVFVETRVDNSAKTPRSNRKSKLKDSPLKTRNVIEESASVGNDDATLKRLKTKRTSKSIVSNKCNIEEVLDEDKCLQTQIDKLKTPKSPCERRLRSKSTGVYQEDEIIPIKMKSHNKNNAHQKLVDSKSELDVQKVTSAKKALVKKLKGSAARGIVEDLVDCDIENDVNEANNAKEMKTPENRCFNGETAENCGYISPFVTVSRGKQRARAEYAQRQSAGGTINSPALQQSTSVKTAAEFFTLLLNKETIKINNNCDFWNTFKNQNNLPEEAVDMIDVATGQGTLLKNKKMESFRNLIQYSLEEQTDKPVTCMDLHGYWDVLNMQIENVNERFESLLKLRDNDWKEILPEKPKKIAASKRISKRLVNTKRSNALREAIKSARLKSKSESADISTDNRKSPKSARKNNISAGKESHKRISELANTPRKSLNSPRSSSPHIMIQVSQVAKSVDRLGSEAVQSAKSILKKRQNFKELGRKPKVVLFDVSDDVFEDCVLLVDNDENKMAKGSSPFVRRSTRLQ